MNYVKLCKEKLDLNTINELVSHESCGAISFFVGTTRDNFNNKQVISLEYEAYESMAVTQIEKICTELRTNWSDIKYIAIYHRLGLVPIKEASVIIAVSSPHRESSLLAIKYAINALKQNVPIWKKEIYADTEGTCLNYEWKENKECAWTTVTSAKVAKHIATNGCK